MTVSNQWLAETPVVDLALARRLEAAEAAVNARFAERTEDVRAVAGGLVVYCGTGSPLTQAIGVGLDGPVSRDQVDEMEDFFRSRGASVAIDLCPHADGTLIDNLAGRGYRMVEFTNKLVRRIPATEARPDPRVRVCDTRDIETWSLVLARGFFNRDQIGPLELRIFKMMFRGSVALLAEVDGHPAGGGAFAAHEGIGLFYSDSTLAAARSRGVQKAVIQTRLAMAGERGCELAMASTAPGSISQMNYERFGFRVVYTRVMLANP